MLVAHHPACCGGQTSHTATTIISTHQYPQYHNPPLHIHHRAQGATFSDASPLPPLYIQAVNVGSGLAGVLVFILRCITKASFGDDPVGLRNGAMVFYFLAVGIVLASLALYLFVLKKLPFVQFYRSRVQYHDKVCLCMCGL